MISDINDIRDIKLKFQRSTIMFEPFYREEKVLSKKPFLDAEVQFNLFYCIIEGKEVTALKTRDNNAIALQNAGYPMWLWINELLPESAIDNIVKSLCIQLKDSKIKGISGKPEFAKAFANQYSNITGALNKTCLSMEAYECKKIIKPKNVSGKLIKAELKHLDIIAEFLVGFAFDCFGISIVKEKQIPGVKSMIESGSLYLWEVEEKICGMVNVAHRSEKYARINNVYISFEERKRGYASAMVSGVCSMLIKEGLIPMLYADITNDDSNKVYKTIGFVKKGRIDNISFDYK
jgi:predicted GNAT family acetyltransferase